MFSCTRFAVALLIFCAGWSHVGYSQTTAADCPRLPAGFEQQVYHDADGDHRYAVFIPRQYDAAKKWPIVLFLHGAGEKGNDGLVPLAGLLAVALERNPETPFIAVFPQCEDVNSRALTGWLAESSDGKRALQILSAVEQKYSVDPDHRILIGWSMGGYGAWSQAAAHPELWSSVLVLAGGALRDQLPLEELARRRVPVWAVSADGDPLVSFERSKSLIEQLQKAEGNGTFTLLRSDDHDVCRTVFSSPQVFQWLLDPKSIDPAGIQLDQVTPLPARTTFYRECIERTQVIPDAFGVRLGNRPFSQLADEIPTLLKDVPLGGPLPDIVRTVGTGANQIRVELSELRYDSEVTRVWLHAISGGRLGLEVDFHPLKLTIGKTSLDSIQHKARTDAVEIRIGIHEPAKLKVEVQPVIENGKLRLRLLRSGFEFTDGNWYIKPPAHVDAQSDRFTPDQLVTGIIGSLYGGKEELIDQVRNVIPDLIAQTEQKLQKLPAPALAKILSPLPVLVPEIHVAPSQISTDKAGVSVICDLDVGVRGEISRVEPRDLLQLQTLPRDWSLSGEIVLDAVSSISQMNISQNFAQVNVLDVSEEQFAEFANPDRMRTVVPELTAEEGTEISSILRLHRPLVVSKSPLPESPRETRLVLSSEGVSIDVYQRRPDEPTMSPVVRLLFRLSQGMTISLPADRDARGAVLTLTWDPEVSVNFLKAESLNGSSVPQADGPAFEKLFGDAWSAWGQAHGKQEIPVTVALLGRKRLQLESLRITDKEFQLQLEARDVPIEVPVESDDDDE